MLAVRQKNTSLNHRSNSVSRAGRQERGRQIGKQTANAEAIAADSLFTIRLKSKGGAEVHTSWGDGIGGRDTYKQLWKIYSVFAEHDELQQQFNPIKYVSEATAIDWVLQNIRKAVPAEFDLDLELEDEIRFVVCKSLESNYGWNSFGVAKLLNALNESNVKFYDLFIDVLKYLHEVIKISLWWDSYSIDILKDEVELQESGDEVLDEGVYLKAKAELDEMKSGAPNNVYHNINDRSLMPIDKILGNLKTMLANDGFEKRLKDILISGCELFGKPYTLCSFGYLPVDIRQDAYLRYEDQSMIMWEIDSVLTEHHSMELDSMANEGVAQAAIFFPVTAETEFIDYEWLRNGFSWPEDLENFFSEMYKLTNEL